MSKKKKELAKNADPQEEDAPSWEEVHEYNHRYLEQDSEYERLLPLVKNLYKDVSAIEEARKKGDWYLREHPEEFCEFNNSLKCLIDPETDPMPFCKMFQKIYKEFISDCVKLHVYFAGSATSRKAYDGRGIDTHERLKVHQELLKFIEETKEKENLTQNGSIELYWEENREKCEKLGWKKSSSLLRDFYRECERAQGIPFPLIDKLPHVCKDMTLKWKSPTDNKNLDNDLKNEDMNI